MPLSPQKVNLVRFYKDSLNPEVSPATLDAIHKELFDILDESFAEFSYSSHFTDMIEHLKMQQALTGQLQGYSLLSVLWKKFAVTAKYKQRTAYVAIA